MTNPFDTGYYFSEQLRAFAFARVGENCRIARNCTIVGLENITLGDNVRIDANTALIVASGTLKIGSYVQIGIGCVIGARGGVVIDDCSSLSHGVRLLSAIDDFSGHSLTNSTLPQEVLAVQAAPIHLERFVPIGTGSVVLPGVTISEGAAVGAHSLVDRSLEGWSIHGGNPIRRLGPRMNDLMAKHAHLAGSADEP